MTATSDVIVVGGGIAGLTVALALADDGRRVTVLDDPRAGAASRAAAGMLAASTGFPAGIRASATAARDLYPALVDRLRETTGIDVPLDRRGILEVAEQDEDLAALRAGAPPGTRQINALELRELEPALARHAGGCLYPHDGSVENMILMDALRVAATRHPLVARCVSSVVAARFGAADAVATTESGDRYAARHLVLAGGAWTGQPAGLPRAIPVRPVRGQIVLLEAQPLRHVVHAPDGYLVPRDRTLLVGATMEEAAWNAGTTEEARTSLLTAASRIAPGLSEARVVRQWAGLRPMTPDQQPILGRDPDEPALLYACGMSRNGILFAPWAAQQLARLLRGDDDGALGPFAIARFDDAPGIRPTPGAAGDGLAVKDNHQ